MASTINMDILNQLKEILDDDFVLVLDSFLEEGEQATNKIEAAIAGGELNEVRKAAHSMKSMAGNVGAMELSELADQLQIVSANNEAERVKELWPEFQRLYLSAAEEISAMK